MSDRRLHELLQHTEGPIDAIRDAMREWRRLIGSHDRAPLYTVTVEDLIATAHDNDLAITAQDVEQHRAMLQDALVNFLDQYITDAKLTAIEVVWPSEDDE